MDFIIKIINHKIIDYYKVNHFKNLQNELIYYFNL